MPQIFYPFLTIEILGNEYQGSIDFRVVIIDMTKIGVITIQDIISCANVMSKTIINDQ